MLVVHENRGLTDHIRSVAGRLAASGYSALAVDLLSEEGGTGSFADEAAVTAALNNVPDSRFVADMKAAVDELERRVPGAKLGAVGFCFGGGMVWTLLASGEPRLAAAAPFYGPLPDGADFAGSPSAAVLGIYAEQDDRVNASRDAATAALEKAGLTHEIVTFPDAGHAFFNDTGQRYNPAAAAAAYDSSSTGSAATSADRTRGGPDVAGSAGAPDSDQGRAGRRVRAGDPGPGPPGPAGAAGRDQPRAVVGLVGLHFGRPTNRLWVTLYEAGLTDRRLRPEQTDELLGPASA